MAKFCKYCGTQLEDSAVFCIQCGQKVGGPVAQPQQAPAQPQQAPAQPKQTTAQPRQTVSQQPQAAPVLCGNCGGTIRAGNAYCTQCGAPRGPDGPPPGQAATAGATTPSPPPRPKSNSP